MVSIARGSKPEMVGTFSGAGSALSSFKRFDQPRYLLSSASFICLHEVVDSSAPEQLPGSPCALQWF